MSTTDAHSEPTHANALQASRSIMKRALTEIAYFGNDGDAQKIALAALGAEHDAYVAGVRSAVD